MHKTKFESNFPVDKEWVSYSTLWNKCVLVRISLRYSAFRNFVMTP